jgi:hypothetical protein
MTLSVAIAAIVFADLAILGILAYATSRAKLLTPHVSLATATVRTPPAAVRPARAAGHIRLARASAVPASA